MAFLRTIRKCSELDYIKNKHTAGGLQVYNLTYIKKIFVSKFAKQVWK